jgi:REP element-mobilizing transposase RayT
MIQRWWDKLPGKFPNLQTEAFVIMPNHIHGIIILVGVDPCVDPTGDPHADPFGDPRDDSQMGQSHETVKPGGVGQPRGVAPTVSLADAVGWYKTMTTNDCIHGVRHSGWTPFSGKLWQCNYYDHIIRDDAECDRIYRYIQTNPAHWDEDRFHPDAPQDRLHSEFF